MPINYVVTKKVDKSKGETKELYYACTRALQRKPVNSSRISEQLAERSSLQNGDALSVLSQLPDIIAEHLREGRTVSIDGLGNFYPSITSEGVETPEECTASKVQISRICFKAAPILLRKVKKTKFISLQLRFAKKGKQKSMEYSGQSLEPNEEQQLSPHE